ncbi:MAG: hypothetical protein MUF42_15555 [Cytophagaceae bacterium]|jgi:hypothetical protein|nr:hypothetical protein [Cytophagaceae bacterium]
MQRDTSKKEQKRNKLSGSQSLTGSISEDFWTKEDEKDGQSLELYNLMFYNQVSDKHVENANQDQEEKPAQEKKLRTILYSETKVINGKEEAIYDDNFLKSIGEQSQKFDMLNGINFTEYLTTTKQKLGSMDINPMTDLVYEITDDELYATDSFGYPKLDEPKFGKTLEKPSTKFGTKDKVISGSINVGSHKKANGINKSNLIINLARTLAHERLAHGYNSILNNIMNESDLHDHTHMTGGGLTDEGDNLREEIIHTPTDQYKKLRQKDTISSQTIINIKSLHNFVNSSHPFFKSGALVYKLDHYTYTNDETLNKDRLFSIMVDKYLSNVKRAVR